MPVAGAAVKLFKSTTDTAGNAAIIAGAVLASQQGRHSEADEVGAGLLLAGLLSKLVSAGTTPAADIRAWDDLPRYLSFASLSLPPGQHLATVEFLDQAGAVLPNLTKTLTLNIPSERKDKVVFVSDQSLTPQTI